MINKITLSKILSILSSGFFLIFITGYLTTENYVEIISIILIMAFYGVLENVVFYIFTAWSRTKLINIFPVIIIISIVIKIIYPYEAVLLYFLVRTYNSLLEHRLEIDNGGENVYVKRNLLVTVSWISSIIIIYIFVEIKPNDIVDFILYAHISLYILYSLFLKRIKIIKDKLEYHPVKILTIFRLKIIFSSLSGYLISNYLILGLKDFYAYEFVKIAFVNSLFGILLSIVTSVQVAQRAKHELNESKKPELIYCLLFLFLGLLLYLIKVLAEYINPIPLIIERFVDKIANLEVISFLVMTYVFQYINSVNAINLRKNKYEPVYYSNIIGIIFVFYYMYDNSINPTIFLCFGLVINLLVYLEIFKSKNEQNF
jgi:hypothetical protein